ncbi:MAG: zinc-binding alcohol dehydrogenase family protein [Chloroflexota bacterium]
MRRLVTTAPSVLELSDGPEPTVGPGEALLAIEAVGICGSDIHLYTGDHPYSRFPTIQGHEFAGRIISLPDDGESGLRVGQRVAVEPLLTCGTCLPCRRGRANCCVRMRTYGSHVDGALRERMAVPVANLYDADDLPPELAAMVEPMSIGVHAVSRAGIGADDTVVVFGAGPIGLAVLLAARDLGGRVLITDRFESRLQLATVLGADLTVDAASEDVPAAIAAWTAGDGPTVVVEATGVPAVLETAIDVVAPSGTVVCVGLSAEAVRIPMITLTRKELTIVGSRNNRGVFGRAADLVRRHRERVATLVTHTFELADGPSAFELAHHSPTTTEKVVIRIRD